MLTRSLTIAAVILAAALGAEGACSQGERVGAVAFAFGADNGGRPFAADGPMLTTISPNGDGFRDRASIHFTLTAPALVQLEIARTEPAPRAMFTETLRLPA